MPAVAANRLSVTRGHILPGVTIDAHTFLTALSTAQLFQLAPDPRLSEDEKSRERFHGAAQIAELRKDVQRAFRGAKSKNVPGYARYLADVSEGHTGLAPTMVLWSQEPLDVGASGDINEVQIPFDMTLIAIDGETQLAARYDAARIRPEILKERVPVMICHGRALNWARQVFHDVNTFGIKPNAAVAVSMDDRDLVTQLSRELAESIPFLKGRVHMSRRQLRRADPEVITLSTLRTATMTLVAGTPGVQQGMRTNPATLLQEEYSTARDLAVQWFTVLTESLGELLEDRARLAGSAPMWAAYGVMGHMLSTTPEADRETAMQHYIQSLRQVNWDRSERWTGIAGKVGPKDSFSIASTKEVIHQLVKALTDPEDEGYKRIHDQPAAE